MADWRQEYWREAVQTAMESIGRFDSLTSAEYDDVGTSLAISAEHQSMATAPVENPLAGENKRLASLLKREESKVVCPTCHGRGRLITYGGTLQCNSQCFRCSGEGYVVP